MMKKMTIGLAMLAAIVCLSGVSAFKPHQTSTSASKSHYNGFYWYLYPSGTYVNEDSQEVEVTYDEDQNPGAVFVTDSTTGCNCFLYEVASTTKSYPGYVLGSMYKIWEVY
jgi:hypothetical protein